MEALIIKFLSLFDLFIYLFFLEKDLELVNRCVFILGLSPLYLLHSKTIGNKRHISTKGRSSPSSIPSVFIIS